MSNIENKKTTIKKRRTKKESVRNYLSEETLKFLIMSVNYSNSIKTIKNSNKEELEDEKNLFYKRKNKRIKSYYTKINKIINLKKNKLSEFDIELDINKIDIENESTELEVAYINSEIDEVQYKALFQILIYLTNIIYVTNEYCFTVDIEDIQTKYKEAIDEYKEHLELLLLQREYETEGFPEGFKKNRSSMKKSEINEYLRFIESHQELNGDDLILRDYFGKAILILIDNVMNMPCFKGYSSNYKTEFKSNSIEKILLYSHNFDPNFISVITRKSSKAFSYLTQISYHAGLEMMKKLNFYYEQRRNDILLSSSLTDGVYNNDSRDYDSYTEEVNVEEFGVELIVDCLESDDLRDIISKKIIEIEDNNVNFEINEAKKYELKLISEATDEEKETDDYQNYKNELISKIKEIKRIDYLDVILNKDCTFDLELDFDFKINLKRK